MQAPRAGVGRDLLDAAAPQLGAGAAAGQVAVEIHGHAELAEPVGQDQRLGDRGAALRAVEIDDRGDVDGSHARVRARVL